MVLAPIERLPLELLQPIFIAADHNIALVDASSHIAARLSSTYIYFSTCNYFLTEVRGTRAKQSAAQTRIFASKWLTWTFFKSWILRRFGSSGCLCDRTVDEGCFDAQWPPDFEDATKMVFSRSHLPRLAFVKGRIPGKLLQGPWTQEKVEFLQFVLWITSMSVDWDNAETAKAAIDGRRQAMLDGYLPAVELFNHNRRLGKAASLETLLFAVLEAGCDRSIVYDTLLTARMWNPPRYSEELHEWCDTQALHGNPKGEWLRKKLDEWLVGDYLNPNSGDYVGGPDDQLWIHNLEWNKVKPHRGWLLSRTDHGPTINHNISWAEVVRTPGYHMYRGPSAPLRLYGGMPDNTNLQLWLSPPASRPLSRSLLQRRNRYKEVVMS